MLASTRTPLCQFRYISNMAFIGGVECEHLCVNTLYALHALKTFATFSR